MSTTIKWCSPADYVGANKRYIGLYHYSTYWNKWDKIIDVDNSWWIVQEVDNFGNPVAGVRKHLTPQHPKTFANQPFVVGCN